jgi:hypothetical protein
MPTCDAIKSQWKMRPGEPLDGAYFDQFRAGPFAEWKKQATPLAGGLNLDLGLGKDAAKGVVNILVFVPAVRQ